MRLCSHCLSHAEPEREHCPVCGIPADKLRSNLALNERKVRFHARMIRGIALLHLTLAGAGLILLISCRIPLAAAIGVTVINLILAFGLARYALWAYRSAAVFYFLIGMVNIISVNLPEVLIILLLLYGIGNGTAKSIFDRNLS